MSQLLEKRRKFCLLSNKFNVLNIFDSIVEFLVEKLLKKVEVYDWIIIYIIDQKPDTLYYKFEIPNIFFVKNIQLLIMYLSYNSQKYIKTKFEKIFLSTMTTK